MRDRGMHPGLDAGLRLQAGFPRHILHHVGPPGDVQYLLRERHHDHRKALPAPEQDDRVHHVRHGDRTDLLVALAHLLRGPGAPASLDRHGHGPLRHLLLHLLAPALHFRTPAPRRLRAVRRREQDQLHGQPLPGPPVPAHPHCLLRGGTVRGQGLPGGAASPVGHHEHHSGGVLRESPRGGYGPDTGLHPGHPIHRR